MEPLADLVRIGHWVLIFVVTFICVVLPVWYFCFKRKEPFRKKMFPAKRSVTIISWLIALNFLKDKAYGFECPITLLEEHIRSHGPGQPTEYLHHASFIQPTIYILAFFIAIAIIYARKNREW